MSEFEFDQKQCIKTETGHFGEPYTSVHEDSTGLILARRSAWTPSQHSEVEHELMGRRGDENRDAGPYEKSILDMAFGGKVYSVGETTGSLRINGQNIDSQSSTFNDSMHDINKALGSIHFDSPYCTGNNQKALYENLDTRKK